MRHSTRRNMRNGALVLTGLACLLIAGGIVVVRKATPEIVTVVEYREVPGVCPGMPEPEEGLLSRIFKPHRRHGPRAVPAPVPQTACIPEGAGSLRQREEQSGAAASEVPEPSTLALLAVGVGVLALGQRARGVA